jgi:hypothetical protein
MLLGVSLFCGTQHRIPDRSSPDCLHDAEALMTRLYFHCTGPGEVILDPIGSEVLDLSDAREYALALARSLVENAYGLRDFSQWQVYVGDEDNDEILLVPFTAALPTLH